jgi:hypothetical protein
MQSVPKTLQSKVRCLLGVVEVLTDSAYAQRSLGPP